MKSRAIVLILLTTAFASFAFAAPKQSCSGIAFSSADKVASTFSAAGTIDIDVLVLFERSEANHFLKAENDLEVHLFTPAGDRYQSLRIPFTSDAGKKGKERKVKHYPYAIETQMLREIEIGKKKYAAAVVRLPVAGTSIMTSSLYGTWSASAHLDDDSEPCAAPATFTVTP